MSKSSSDALVDEKGYKVAHDEPKVSKKTGKRKKAKPRAIKPSQIDKICNLIRAGNYVKPSVLAVGCNYSTFLSYMNKGKKEIRPYDEYYRKVEMAKAGFETDAVSTISDSGKEGNIGAYMWMLPRMFPNRWGATKRQEIKMDTSQEITIRKFSDVNKTDDE